MKTDGVPSVDPTCKHCRGNGFKESYCPHCQRCQEAGCTKLRGAASSLCPHHELLATEKRGELEARAKLTAARRERKKTMRAALEVSPLRGYNRAESLIRDD